MKYHSFILYSSYIVLKLTKKKLFIFNIFDLFNTMNFLIIFYLGFFLWFLFVVFMFNFFKSSFYKNQNNFFSVFLFKLIYFRLINFLFINFLFIYLLVYLLIYWQFTKILNSFYFFDIQVKLIDFILIWIKINCKLNFILDMVLLVNFLLLANLSWLMIYKKFKTYKKWLLIFSLILSIVILDSFYYLLILILILFEFYYIFLCHKINFYFINKM